MAANYTNLDDGYKLQFLDLSVKTFLQKIILLYGETGSGKSVIIRNLIRILSANDVVPVIIVIAPTDDSNSMYSGIVPPQLIFHKPTVELLENIYARQEYVSAIYKIVSDRKNLKRVFDMCDERAALMLERTINNAADNALSSLAMVKDGFARERERDQIEEGRQGRLIDLYKTVITKNRANLLANKERLTEDEALVVEFIELNPNLLLILDDCASDKGWQKSEVVLKLFYQGRNYYFTSVISFQGDKDLVPSIRRQAHIAMFTTPESAMAYFGTKTNGHSKEHVKRAEKIIGKIFASSDGPSHIKLVTIRGAPDPFRIFTAKKYDKFDTCDQYVREFCSGLKPKKKAITSYKA